MPAEGPEIRKSSREVALVVWRQVGVFVGCRSKMANLSSEERVFRRAYSHDSGA